MSNDPKHDENGDRLFCDAWRGARTPEFRKFKRDFKASADAMFLHAMDHLGFMRHASCWQPCSMAFSRCCAPFLPPVYSGRLEP